MINVAVVGCGYWGPNLIRNFQQLATLRTVCDLDEKKLAQIKRTYPWVDTTQDFDDILSDPHIDAVVIATPVRSHFKLAKQALLAAKHVLVEKPMATTCAEGEELIALAKQGGLTLMVGHTFEYSPPVKKIKEIISNGEIGDIYYISASRVNLGLLQPDISVIWDLGPHDVSIILYWLDMMPAKVSARGMGYVRKDIEEVGFINMEFPNKVMSHIDISWIAPCKLRRTEIVGQKKMIVYDDTEHMEKVKVFDKGVSLKNPEDFGEFQLTYREGDIYCPHIATIEPLNAECRHFLNCIENEEKPQTDGQSGLRVVKVLEAAQRSLLNDGKAEPIAN